MFSWSAIPVCLFSYNFVAVVVVVVVNPVMLAVDLEHDQRFWRGFQHTPRKIHQKQTS